MSDRVLFGAIRKTQRLDKRADLIPSIRNGGNRRNGKGLHMQSKTTPSMLHASPSKNLLRAICAGILFASFMTMVEPASALIPQSQGSLQNQLRQDGPITEVYVDAEAARAGPRSSARAAAASRTVVRGGAVVRPGGVRPGGWGSSGSLLLASGRRGSLLALRLKSIDGHRGSLGGAPPALATAGITTDPSWRQGGVSGRLSVERRPEVRHDVECGPTPGRMRSAIEQCN